MMRDQELRHAIRSADHAREDLADAASRWRDRPDDEHAAELRRAVDAYREASRQGALALLEILRFYRLP